MNSAIIQLPRSLPLRLRRLQRLGLAMLCGATAGFALACEPPLIVVNSPAPDEEMTHQPLAIALWVRPKLDGGTLHVRLNGVDISGLFDLYLGNVLWLARDVWQPDGLLLGNNELIASGIFDGEYFETTQFFTTEGDAFADCVDSVTFGTSGGFGSEAQVLGAPSGAGAFQGSTDVLSLGLGGEIVVEFRDNTIVDGLGVDFTVFENPFLPFNQYLETLPPFMEPGRVSVSQDGATWYTFSCALDIGEEGIFHPGCAGVYPVFADGLDPMTPHGAIPTSTPIEDLIGQDLLAFPTPEGAGGDSFDLADVGLEWAAYVRIESASFNAGPVGPTNAGFDLDAVAAVNSTPSGLDPACP